ncbi:MAG: PaaI family thioesterase [Alphaproteobacteria bacterium]|nr:PaaI family thioesterase [Alphaproteobacteria bacterium]
MTAFVPKFPGWEARVRDSFARQPAMDLIGATLGALAPGAVDIELPFDRRITQQHGYVHGGVVAMVADSAAGYAGFSLVPESATVLTVEYKMNFLAPAEGPLLRARGRALKAGRSLIIVQVDVFNCRGEAASICATMLQTLMVMHGRADAPR